MRRPPENSHLIAATLMASVAWASLAYAELSALRPLKVSEFFVPAEAGYVTERIEPAASAAAPVLIYIQEAHANYEAQQRIVQILEDLVARYQLKLILVEGGEGPVGMAHMRALADPERRRQVADKYLRAGILSAEEYLDMVSDHDLTLWGIEQVGLYDQNLRAFEAAQPLRAKIVPHLEAISQTLQPLADRAHPDLKVLEQADAAYASHELKAAAYAGRLAELAGRYDVPESDARMVYQLLQVSRLEAQVDTPALAADQKALLGRLGQLVSPTEFDALLALARGAAAGPAPRLTFYRRMSSLASSHNVSIESYPHLARHQQLLKDAAAVNPQALADQLKALSASLRLRVSDTPQQRATTEVRTELELVRKLAELRLSPSEHERLAARTPQARWAAWRLLLAEAGAEGEAWRVAELELLLPTCERFYEVAKERDAALLENALAKLEASGEPVAVLITGGFHGPAVTRRLQARGFGAVVITPKVTQATDERLYAAVLKYKSGQGSLDEVLAAANMTTTKEE